MHFLCKSEPDGLSIRGALPNFDGENLQAKELLFYMNRKPIQLNSDAQHLIHIKKIFLFRWTISGISLGAENI